MGNSKLITIAALFAVTNAVSCNGDEDCIKEWLATFVPIQTEETANQDKKDEQNDEKDEKTAEDDTANETTETENEETKVGDAEVIDPSLEDELANSDVVAAELEVN